MKALMMMMGGAAMIKSIFMGGYGNLEKPKNKTWVAGGEQEGEEGLEHKGAN
jgi:hypothetical protein